MHAIKYARDYEKELVFKWGYPKAVEEFMELVKVFGPVVFRLAFEKLIYPSVLSDNPDEENEFTVLGIDQACMHVGKLLSIYGTEFTYMDVPTAGLSSFFI